MSKPSAWMIVSSVYGPEHATLDEQDAERDRVHMEGQYNHRCTKAPLYTAEAAAEMMAQKLEDRATELREHPESGGVAGFVGRQIQAEHFARAARYLRGEAS